LTLKLTIYETNSVSKSGIDQA